MLRNIDNIVAILSQELEISKEKVISDINEYIVTRGKENDHHERLYLAREYLIDRLIDIREKELSMPEFKKRYHIK